MLLTWCPPKVYRRKRISVESQFAGQRIAREVARRERAWDVVNKKPAKLMVVGYLALYMLLAGASFGWLSGIGSARWIHPLVRVLLIVIPFAVLMLLHGYIDMRRRLDAAVELLRQQEQRSR